MRLLTDFAQSFDSGITVTIGAAPRQPIEGSLGCFSQPLMIGSFGPRMLRLTAQYADLWNTAYLSQPATLTKPRQALWEACQEMGRDPATLSITALVALGYPDLVAQMPEFENGVLTGSTDEIAAALRSYAQMGVAHLMFHLAPHTSEALARLAEAILRYRESKN
jgi:alkanesulfonate monooxygenase SsuD/methylene tetrahydromethanopterin reductase-like flavin-dependent oxidoreductase (luciferase family)